MSKHISTMFFVVAMLIIVSLACNFSNRSPGVDAVNSDPAPQQPDAPTEVLSSPIGIRQGLASLNSYRLAIKVIANGPTTNDKNTQQTQYEYSSELDAWHSHTESTASSADDPEGSSDNSDEYHVGDRTCSLPGDNDDGSSTIEELNPLQQEMMDAMSGLVDMVIYVENPVFVGEESVNGVQANHFTFKVTGLGDKSGAEVTKSEGEYWVAVDGQYLVKYSAFMETRSGPPDDPNSEAMYTEVNIDLLDINQPVQISLPAECK